MFRRSSNINLIDDVPDEVSSLEEMRKRIQHSTRRRKMNKMMRGKMRRNIKWVKTHGKHLRTTDNLGPDQSDVIAPSMKEEKGFVPEEGTTSNLVLAIPDQNLTNNNADILRDSIHSAHDFDTRYSIHGDKFRKTATSLGVDVSDIRDMADVGRLAPADRFKILSSLGLVSARV